MRRLLALLSLALLAQTAAAAGARDPACRALEVPGRTDQLSLPEARACFAECRASFASSPPWLRALLPALLALAALFAPCVVLIKCGTQMEMVGALRFSMVVPALYLHLVAALADWTGFMLEGHGTSCFKAATAALFGPFPAWLGLVLGLLLLAHATHEAFRQEVNESMLRGFCNRVPADEVEEPDTKVLGLVTVRKERLERAKIVAKASVCLGDVVLDSGSLASFLHQGQPSYALLTLLCIVTAEQFAKGQMTPDYTPHIAETRRLSGWQADFIYFWRESICLGMASPAFLLRLVSEVQNETAWCSYVQFSALLSSTYSSYYPLFTLCASTGMACLTVMSWGPINEVSFSEDDIAMGALDGAGKFEVLHHSCRLIPRADFFARRKIQALRSAQLVGFYRLCEFLSKGVVTTALMHLLRPAGTYLAGLLVALLLWPWRLRTGHQKGPSLLLMWPGPYLKPATYPLTIPTSKSWHEPDSSSPAVTIAFLSIMWVLLLALSWRSGWAQKLWAGATAGEVTAARTHRLVKLALFAVGLLAQLGLAVLAVVLQRHRSAWYEEDKARLERVVESFNDPHFHHGYDGAVLHRELLDEGPRPRKLLGRGAREGEERLLSRD